MSFNVLKRGGPELTAKDRVLMAEYYAHETRKMLERSVQANTQLSKPEISLHAVNFTREAGGITGGTEADAFAVDVYVDRTGPHGTLERCRLARFVCSSRNFCLLTQSGRRHHFDDRVWNDRLKLLAASLAGKNISPIQRFMYL